MSDLDCYAIELFSRRDPGSRLVSAGVTWETLSISNLLKDGWSAAIMQLAVHRDLVSIWYYADHKADFLFSSPEGAKAFVKAVHELMGEDLISTSDA